ncbi:MAG TPA: trimeric intracellular cation channel family protein [Stellaceae bacterium]|nr:trimeric intracellular cation channel family protein [Stellaceae bacterium]
MLRRSRARVHDSDATYAARTLVLVADLAGSFVFAVEGALTAIASNLDLLGIAVLSFATALCGGMVRDVLIGAVPPNAIRDWRYCAVAFTAAGLTFLLWPFVEHVPRPIIIGLDAAGLSLFAVAGAEKALDYGIHPFIAALMGTITAAGGGTIRDVLLAQVPGVLRVDIYATAALFGSVIVVLGRTLRLPPVPVAISGGLACFVLRLVALWRNWQLPHAG